MMRLTASLLASLSIFIFMVSIHSAVRATEVRAASVQEKLSARQIQRLSGWKTYKTLCSDCHGDKGDGRGPLGKTMTPEPANYQNCDVLGKVSDEQIRTLVMEGSEALGKSNAMPGFKKKIQDPASVDQLIEIVRSFGGCAYQESR